MDDIKVIGKSEEELRNGIWIVKAVATIWKWRMG